RRDDGLAWSATAMKLPSHRRRDLVDRRAACRRRGRKLGPARRSRRPQVEALECRQTPSTFTVTNTLDLGPGSWRDAIRLATAASGPDRIAFAIPTTDPGFRDADHDGRFDPGDSWSIAPTAALPAITGPLLLDGWSQGGPGDRANPPIELDGAEA